MCMSPTPPPLQKEQLTYYPCFILDLHIRWFFLKSILLLIWKPQHFFFHPDKKRVRTQRTKCYHPCIILTEDSDAQRGPGKSEDPSFCPLTLRPEYLQPTLGSGLSVTHLLTSFRSRKGILTFILFIRLTSHWRTVVGTQ